MAAALRAARVLSFVLLLTALSGCGGGGGDASGVAAGPPLQQRIELAATRIVAGTPIPADIVIVNRGGPINLSRGCRPGYTIALSSHGRAPIVAWPTVCVAGPFVIPHGTTRLPTTVSTTDVACSQSGQGTPSFPACVDGDGMPPLPPGVYQAVLVWESRVPLPRAQPVTVTLLAP